jgi:formate-dependent nitrite reductase membrane component NrfD
VVAILGTVFGLFIAGYTGVLLAVSNQPVWSDTWTLGGLFLASGLSSAVAVLTLLSRYRRGAEASADVLHVSERLYAGLELVMIVLFVLSLIGTGALGRVFGFPFFLLWLVVFASLVPGIHGLVKDRLEVGDHGAGDHGGASEPSPAAGTSAVASPARAPAAIAMSPEVAIPVLVLVGVMCLRGAVIFSVL